MSFTHYCARGVFTSVPYKGNDHSVGESQGPNFMNILAENAAQQISLLSKILLSASQTRYTPYDREKLHIESSFGNAFIDQLINP